MSEQNFDTQQVIPQDENEELDVFTILKICFAVFIRNWKWIGISVPYSRLCSAEKAVSRL